MPYMRVIYMQYIRVICMQYIRVIWMQYIRVIYSRASRAGAGDAVSSLFTAVGDGFLPLSQVHAPRLSQVNPPRRRRVRRESRRRPQMAPCVAGLPGFLRRCISR